ncbi:MAG: bifunctional 5,10-methylenetetrahydrofolate dehydrogenase/5,10-methenyltetrahydrofolate cyclohydrolase [Syntrophomonadaceae bacterium]
MEAISGAQIAGEIRDRLRNENTRLGLMPCLAVILVGSQEDSAMYVRLKEKAALDIGGRFCLETLPEAASADALLELIEQLNRDDTVDGIILQLPLPAHLEPRREIFLKAIEPLKDVDGFHQENRGSLLGGEPAFTSCAALACLEVIERYAKPLQDKRVLLVGESFDLIMPLTLLLMKARCRVSVVPEPSGEILDNCDIVVVEQGRAGIIKSLGEDGPELILDAGFYVTPQGLQGNVDREQLSRYSGRLLPVPGGMGPILVAKLMENVTLAALRRTACRNS